MRMATAAGVAVVVMVVVIRPRLRAQHRQAAPCQPQADRRDQDRAGLHHRDLRQVGQGLAPQVQDGDAAPDQGYGRARLRQRRCNRQPGQPRQRHLGAEPIAADDHLAMPRPDRMGDAIGKAQPQQRRDRPRLARPQRPQGPGHRVLDGPLLVGGPPLDPGQTAAQPQRHQRQGDNQPRQGDGAPHDPAPQRTCTESAPVAPMSTVIRSASSALWPSPRASPTARA